LDFKKFLLLASFHEEKRKAGGKNLQFSSSAWVSREREKDCGGGIVEFVLRIFLLRI
jgi:hypothetical protein